MQGVERAIVGYLLLRWGDLLLFACPLHQWGWNGKIRDAYVKDDSTIRPLLKHVQYLSVALDSLEQ